MEQTNFFGKIETVNAQRDSEFLRAGRYLVAINKFIGKELRDGGGKAALFELTVLKVLDDTAAAQEPKGPHLPGDKTTWMFMLRYDAAWSALKGALAAILGVKPEAVTGKECNECAASDQPLAGMVLELDGKVIVTKGNQRPLNRVVVKRVVPPEEALQSVPAEMIKSWGVTLI